MEKNSPGLIYLIQKKWKWGDCKLIIRRTNLSFYNQQSYETLQAEVQLENQQIQQPFQPVITFQKSFTFRKNKGFVWQKNKVIPSLLIKIPEVYLQLLKEDQQIISTFCEISAAYPKKKQNHYYLQEIKLKGQNKKVFSEKGQAQFQHLYFTSHSKAEQSNNFCFIISICVSTLDDNRLIIKSMISSSIKVEQSKINRKKKQKPISFCLLTPQQFAQPIFNQNQITEKQSKFSLFNFLAFYNQNPDKILKNHPFYFAYHFSNLFKLYYNYKKINEPHNIIDYLYRQPFYSLKKKKKLKKSSQQSKPRRIKKSNKTQIQLQSRKQNIQNKNKDKKLLMIVLNQFWKKQPQKSSQNDMCEQSNLKYITDRSLQNQIQRIKLIFKIWTNHFLQLSLASQSLLDEKWTPLTSNEILASYSLYFNKIVQQIKQKKSLELQQEKIQIQQNKQKIDKKEQIQVDMNSFNSENRGQNSYSEQ